MTKINNPKQGVMANCLALHDFSIANPDLRTWTKYVTEFFQQYNIIPNKISPASRTGRKNINFNNGIRQLDACNYEVKHVWIGALPQEHSSDIFDAVFSTSINLELNDTSCLICYDNDIASFNAQIINHLALDLYGLVGAKYGYAYQRPFRKGPTWYPYGIISGLEYCHQEADLITKWQDEYVMPDGSYKTGDLRDIYPINILSCAHMNRIIYDQRFENWILSSASLGKLERLAEDLWSWQVADDEISNVREALHESGMVLCI